MFTQRLSSPQRQQIVDSLIAVLQNNPPYGIKLFARNKQIAMILAQDVIDAASRKVDDETCLFGYGDAASIAASLRISSRTERLTARRTLAQIIREEIKVERIIPVYTHASLMCGGGVDIPEHAVMTAEQFAATQSS